MPLHSKESETDSSVKETRPMPDQNQTVVVDDKNISGMMDALRDANLKVTEIPGGYECKKGDIVLFKALHLARRSRREGNDHYMVRMREDLFV